MQRGLGWNRAKENHAWLAKHQLRFHHSHFAAYRVPEEIDARSTQTVKDQGQLGSCSGFSRSSLEERLNFIVTGQKGPALSAMFAYLTNQQECDCFGADNGATIAGSVQAATKEGICEDTLFPYNGRYTTTIPDQASAEGKLHPVKSHSVIADYQSAMQYLGTAGVIQIGVPVGSGFQNCSGPLTAQAVQRDSHNPEGGHALAVIGYLKPATIGVPNGDGRAWLLGQNSWGASGWGANGFFFIDPKAWDYWAKIVPHGDVELIGMSGLAAFSDPTSAIDWSDVFAATRRWELAA
jgi:C1A family cysteine protease